VPLAFMMSHDLMTPLTNILGYSETLLEEHGGRLNKRQRTDLSRIVANSLYMNDLVQSILTGIRIDAGKVLVHPRLEDLPTLIKSSLMRNQYLATRKGVTILQSFCAGRLAITVDSKNLGQVMNNLIANAVNFTPIGSTVTVGFDLLPGKVRVFVADQGKGLHGKNQGGLFKKFPVISVTAASQEEGNGLGLFIVAHLVHLNHGEVGFDTSRSGGAIFWFTLPLEAALVIEKRQPALHTSASRLVEVVALSELAANRPGSRADEPLDRM
jgi:two-component system phosphate regulon sensor histidine kinase PhoR